MLFEHVLIKLSYQLATGTLRKIKGASGSLDAILPRLSRILICSAQWWQKEATSVSRPSITWRETVSQAQFVKYVFPSIESLKGVVIPEKGFAIKILCVCGTKRM